jgi:hypothetical protein
MNTQKQNDAAYQLIVDRIFTFKALLAKRQIGNAQEEQDFILGTILKIQNACNVSFDMHWRITYSYEGNNYSTFYLKQFTINELFDLGSFNISIPIYFFSNSSVPLKSEVQKIFDLYIQYFRYFTASADYASDKVKKMASDFNAKATLLNTEIGNCVSKIVSFLYAILLEYKYVYYQYVFGFDAYVGIENNKGFVQSNIRFSYTLQGLRNHYDAQIAAYHKDNSLRYFPSLYCKYWDDYTANFKQTILQNREIDTIEIEKEFMLSNLKKIFKEYPNFEKFSWQQRYDYNDNYSFYDFTEIMVNDNIDLGLYCGFTDNGWKLKTYNEECKQPFDWHLDISNEYITYSEEEAMTDEERLTINGYVLGYKKGNADVLTFRDGISKAVALLKALYEHYGYYYFIYVFEYESMVTFTKQGLQLDVITKNTYSLQELAAQDLNAD